MRKTVVKLSVAIFTISLFLCMLTLGVHAQTQLPSDGGYYTISNIDSGRYLAVSDDGGILLGAEFSEKALFRICISDNGVSTVRSVAAEDTFLSYAEREDGSVSYVCSDVTDPCAQLDINGGDGVYTISPAAAGGTLLFSCAETDLVLSPDKNGSGVNWRIEEYKPESMTLSLYSVKTRPYTAYTDLRAVITPASMAPYIEWSSSDRSIAIVDDDGKFCALSEGNTVITASFGSMQLSCDVTVTEQSSFAWYSQNNISTGGWNGEPLKDLYFSSGGVRKRFAANNSTKNTDWLSEGCAVCSIAQVLNNMGARYTNGYDLRSGIDTNVMADPYTVALANVGNKGPEKAATTLWGDPVLTRQNLIASSFNVDGKRVTVQIKYSVTKRAIKEALDKSPWGVVVCFENTAYGKHYITFNKCLNPDAENPNDYIFTVSDPASVNAYNASDVVFEESYSYKRLYYRFYQATVMQVWGHEQ